MYQLLDICTSSCVHIFMYIKLCTLFSLIMLNMLYKIIVYRITLNVCPEVINKSFWKWCIGHMYIKLCTHIHTLFSLIMLNMLYKIIVYRITLNVCPEVINKSFWKWCIGHMYIKLCTHIQLLYLVWLCSICCTKLLCIESLWMFVQKLINKSFWKWCIGHMYIKLCTHIQATLFSLIIAQYVVQNYCV